MGMVFGNPPVRGPEQSDEEYCEMIDKDREFMRQLFGRYQSEMRPYATIGWAGVAAAVVLLVLLCLAAGCMSDEERRQQEWVQVPCEVIKVLPCPGNSFDDIVIRHPDGTKDGRRSARGVYEVGEIHSERMRRFEAEEKGHTAK